MADDVPPPPRSPRRAAPAVAAEALRAALEAFEAHQGVVERLKAEARRREEEREALIQAHSAREAAIRAEAKALLRAMPKRHTAGWSPAERAQVREALRAAAACRLNLSLGELPPVPAPEPPRKLPRLRRTKDQRRALRAAQRRAKATGQALLPEGLQLTRPTKPGKVRPTRRLKPLAKARRRRAAPTDTPTASPPPGPWTISEDGLE